MFYSEYIKSKIISELFLEKKSINEISRNTGISNLTISKWKKDFLKYFDEITINNEVLKEMVRLKFRINEKEKECDSLKNSLEIFIKK